MHCHVLQQVAMYCHMLPQLAMYCPSEFHLHVHVNGSPESANVFPLLTRSCHVTFSLSLFPIPLLLYEEEIKLKAA